jgi:hypothetical protein
MPQYPWRRSGGRGRLERPPGAAGQTGRRRSLTWHEMPLAMANDGARRRDKPVGPARGPGRRRSDRSGRAAATQVINWDDFQLIARTRTSPEGAS